ncbi:hypothetical protein Mal64_28260 [Pseudobythopirellula maris]|uniref:EamA-like transporter family protein n=1 Tax=Pseudobythopirellula maris TaxID=2527991 RepID=A0A5C5ZJC9_9BACT|nr:hypothetical protein [Pseudobythopirellula maris]TWT87288.1 hypothetical protein Mal64_28260 [Pseudobythopirellula maris]
MKNILFVIASFGVTIIAWGLYGPTLHIGQHDMSLVDGAFARWRPFVCVGMSYFLIGVLVPAVLLATKGEKGAWTVSGATMSLLAGVLGALGALGIVLAFTFGGRPEVVMPLVFGGAPVVNSFITIYMARKMKEIGPVFLAGLVMVVLGAVTVLTFKPTAHPPHPPVTAEVDALGEEQHDSVADEIASDAKQAAVVGSSVVFQILSIAMVVCCWGSYGPSLHHGQSAMKGSRLRPLLCVGLSYFAIAVLVPNLLLSVVTVEASEYNLSGTFWSLAAGAAGAIGALGIIMAFNFGGKPVYVMPLVFGGAPVVTTFASILGTDAMSQTSPFRMAIFFAGLMLVIAGSAMVLVFAPRGAPPKQAAATAAEPAESTPIGDAAE